MDLLNIGTIYANFQDLWNKFSFLFGQLCDKKTCASVVMEIGNKVVWAGGGMGRSHQAESALFVGVCVCRVCGTEGGLGGHDQASNVALAGKYL